MYAWSVTYVDCDDDAFSRGTHKARVSAQIEAGFIRFKARKDHRTLAVRTERTLARGFSMKKRGDGTIEHNTLPLVGRERRRRDKAVNVAIMRFRIPKSGQ